MASVAAGYLPILLFLIVALGLSSAFVVLPMIVSRFTGAHKPDPAKLSEYECGFPAFEDAQSRLPAVANQWFRSPKLTAGTPSVGSRTGRDQLPPPSAVVQAQAPPCRATRNP